MTAGGHPGVDPAPVAVLEQTRRSGQCWDQIAPRYGVTNADPPWKTSLFATCESLAAAGALDALDRRRSEDALGETTYRDVPAPERQLLALAHTLLARGLLTEPDLARRMTAIRTRLQSA